MLVLAFVTQILLLSAQLFYSAESTGGMPSSISIVENSTDVVILPNPSGHSSYAARAVADVNRDGIDDIVIIGANGYGAADCPRIDEISIPSGNPFIGESNDAREPATIRWEGESSAIFARHVAAGGIRTDYVVDLIVPGATIESGTSGFFGIPLSTKCSRAATFRKIPPA